MENQETFKSRLSKRALEFPTIAQLVERPTVVDKIAAIGRSLVRIRVVGSFLLAGALTSLD